MSRLIACAAAAALLLGAGAARADAAPIGCGSHHEHAPSPPCTVEGYGGPDLCQACTDQACADAATEAGFVLRCTSQWVGSDVITSVLCKPADPAQRAALLPAAGVLLGVSALASMRLRRRRWTPASHRDA